MLYDDTNPIRKRRIGQGGGCSNTTRVVKRGDAGIGAAEALSGGPTAPSASISTAQVTCDWIGDLLWASPIITVTPITIAGGGERRGHWQ